MRVMWSGKWAVVTPHAVLNAVWRLVPAFRGYSQQDAQEFLCEALEVLQSELRLWPEVCLGQPPPSIILPSLFQGHLSSQVTYRRCRHSSMKIDPFCDLSVDFPERYQGDERKPQQKNQHLQTCSLDGRWSSKVTCRVTIVLREQHSAVGDPSNRDTNETYKKEWQY
jgi:ubiquitin carboxyl-terminal hydrolase 44/49